MRPWLASRDQRPLTDVAVERHFVGWKRPLLESCVSWLARDGELPRQPEELGSYVLVVSGSRAGRRLLEALAIELAGQDFVPPAIVTPSRLLGVLLPSRARVAKPVEAILAWRQAVTEVAGRQSLIDTLGPIWERPGEVLVADLAEELRSVADELGVEGLSLGDVARRLSRAQGELDQERWQSLSALESRYREVLSRADLHCPHAERQRALGEPALTRPRVVTLGVPELPGMVRQALEATAARVDVVVGAPEELADAFDRWGQPQVDFWTVRTLELEAAVQETGEDLGGMIELAAADVPPVPSDMTLGVGDQRLLPSLCDELELRRIPFHSPIGRTFAASRPAVALRHAARFLESRFLADLGVALRCPDLESWLRRALGAEATDPPPDDTRRASGALADDDWLTALDEYATATLATTVPGDQISGAVEQWLARLDRALTDAFDLEDARRRSASDWAETLSDVLIDWFGESSLDLTVAEDAELVASLDRCGEVLNALRDLPSSLDRQLSLTEVLGVLSEVAGQTPLASATSHSQGVEILGWLELAMDDAQHLAILGLNEGSIPAAYGAEALLPRQTRRFLGLPDDDRRLARDAYLLQSLVHSRSRVLLLSSLAGAEDEPLLPSRLLLLRPPDELPAALRAFYETTGAEEWAAEARTPAAAPFVFGGEIPESLPVTAFRDYLSCPYRFYLKRLQDARAVRDRPRELEGGAFGNLTHDVLSRFARTELARASDPDFVEAGLAELLDDAVRRQLASEVGPAVRVQLAQLRHRLARFAVWQCAQVEDGWQILPDLCEIDLEAGLDVDGEPMRVRGRIDRVDRHPVFGLRLLDYKTSDSPKSPAITHQRLGEWIDLQLPLYRFLMEDRGLEPKILGFVQLSKKHRQPELMAPAKWTDDEHFEALEKARWVVRQIRARRYWPPGEPPEYLDGLELLAGDSLPSRWRLESLARGTDWSEGEETP